MNSIVKALRLILVTVLPLLSTTTEAQIVCGTSVPDRPGLMRPAIAQKGGAGLKVIPVVVHVLHTNGPENISDAQIMDGLAALNEAYHMQAGDTLGTFPANTVVTADAQVAFCLATIDPQGEHTSGIDRIHSELTNDGTNPAAKLNPWPRASYLNIWVVSSAGATSGFALYPVDADALPEQDGVVILHNYFGGIGTGSTNLRHTLSHEVGHYLNLLHPGDIPTGSGNCGDDLVSDTPITSLGFTCPMNVSVCAPPTIEYLPNFMNFYACQKMFTAGQAERIQACLNSPLAERNSLWTEANIAATGACLPTGLVEMRSTRTVAVLPNPFQDKVRITGCSPGTIQVQLYDVRGALLFDRSLSVDAFGMLELDLSGMSEPGLYLLHLSDSSGKVSVRVVREAF